MCKSMQHYESLQRYCTFVGEWLVRRRRWFTHIFLTAFSGAAVVLLASLSLVALQVLAPKVLGLTTWMELVDYSDGSDRGLNLAADLGHLPADLLGHHPLQDRAEGETFAE